MKLSDITLDLSAVDDGAWVENIPDLEAVAFCVRGTEYQPYQKALRQTMVAQSRRQRLQAQTDVERFATVQNKLIVEHLLIDWRGLEDEAGAEIPYSVALAKQIMEDRQYRRLQRGVQYAIDLVDNNLVEHREEAVGN